MAYFVTGATGFIGQFLIRNLLARRQPIYVLVRKGSVKKLDALREQWGATEKDVIAVIGDLGGRNLGVSPADVKKLKGKVDHMFHLAAVYDLKASADEQQKANVDGTRHAVQFAQAVNAGCFHHVSSIAAAGLYDGVFREDMFDEAEELDHPYFRTKHDSEKVVRDGVQAAVPDLPAGVRRRRLEDRVHRQDRRAVLLLQAAAEDAQHAAAMDAHAGHRGRAHQHRAGRLRRRRARPHRAQEGPRRPLLPPDRHESAPDRRGPQHLREGRARAADDDAAQRAHVRLHPGAGALRAGLARARQAHGARGARRPRHPEGRVPVRQLADALRQPRDREGAEGVRHQRARARELRAAHLGLLGAQPRPRPLHRPQPRPAA